MATSTIIDWSGALDQCGGDEEFLTELLEDFNAELDTQMMKIGSELSKNTFGPHEHLVVQRAAHVVKGAAANLMCPDLKENATRLEQLAKSQSTKDLLVSHYHALTISVTNFRQAVANRN